MDEQRTGDVPGADMAVFRRFIDFAERLIRHLEQDGMEFHSLYSVMPLLTQLIGLENPILGSGDSPFSIISILPRMTDLSLIEWGTELSFKERRVLIDEVYEMIAPTLLGEEEAYIDLMIDTVHAESLAGSPSRSEAFRRIQREKFARVSPLAHGVKAASNPVRFAHIAHYGYDSDLKREHAFLKGFSPERFEAWCARSFLTVFELDFRGFQSANRDVRGWIIVSNNSTEQLLYSHRLRNSKIPQCARLAEKLGAQVTGMAGLIASFGQGGYQLSEGFPTLSLTTGHAYTIANILDIAQASAQQSGLDLKEVPVAIVGAAGSIGAGCAKLFARLGVSQLILIDLLWEEHLPKLAVELRHINERIKITSTYQLEAMRAADLTVVATNSPKTIIRSEYLKPGAIIIDDSFPKNVPEDISRTRDDLICLEGGIVKLPPDIDIDRARNIPNIMDVPLTRMLSCRELYGCFAETLILTALNHYGNYGLGLSDPDLAEDILHKGRDIGFTRAPLQFSGLAIREERFLQLAQCRDDENT